MPTPLVDNAPFSHEVIELITQALETDDCVFVMEDAKPARRRWLSSGLPREQVEKFVYLNEHTKAETLPQLGQLLKQGQRLFLMSDGGLPCIADPGVELVDYCHRNKIKVSAAPFENSPILALALSGFEARQFVFQGFPPKDKAQRESFLQVVAQERRVQILMDTPYRLSRLLHEFSQHSLLSHRELFIGLNLSYDAERLLRGSARELLSQLDGQKEEFILIVNQMI